MKNIIKSLLSFIIIFSIASCSKDEITEDLGIPTELKGKVSDNIRNTNINGYKIKLVTSESSCSNWMCGLKLTDVGSAVTDINGEFLIKFNYKLKAGQSYGIEEQYYGNPYFPEYLPNGSGGIKSGQTNILNINAWKPITLRLNLNIINNNFSPLHVRNEIGNSNESFLNTEFIYEQNITKTYDLRSRPDSDIKIIFWYYTGTNPVPTLHQKTILYHTTMDDINILNYNIDCTTF